MRTPPRIAVTLCFAWFAMIARIGAAESTGVAAEAINALGLDLLRHSANDGGNFLLSPYSIQTALVMTYAGADGVTKTEMARVLHYPSDEAAVHASFAALQSTLAAASARTKKTADAVRARLDAIPAGRPGLAPGQERNFFNELDIPGNREPLILEVANRLYGRIDADSYGASLEPLDFAQNPGAAVLKVNSWIAGQTHDRISNLLTTTDVDQLPALLLVNAVYLKAPWEDPFPAAATKPLSFRLPKGPAVKVSTMIRSAATGFAHFDGYAVVTVPYIGDLQFVVFLPDDVGGLPTLEKKLTPQVIADAASIPMSKITLFLPKLHLTPDRIELQKDLRALGMKTAFDPKNANFDRMATKPLFISKVIHKAFLDLDEKGTEAAAATVVEMAFGAGPGWVPPEVRVDHPFLFAIQHRPSGTCLFLGRVTDPR